MSVKGKQRGEMGRVEMWTRKQMDAGHDFTNGVLMRQRYKQEFDKTLNHQDVLAYGQVYQMELANTPKTSIKVSKRERRIKTFISDELETHLTEINAAVTQVGVDNASIIADTIERVGIADFKAAVKLIRALKPQVAGDNKGATS